MTIQFSLRSLAGLDCPWSVVRELASVDVAQDELVAWAPPSEAQILRVAAAGEDDARCAALVGDWLLAPTFRSPRRVPVARWEYNQPSLAWSAGKSWLDAWSLCDVGLWLLHHTPLPPRWHVRAACAVAAEVVPCLPVSTRAEAQAELALVAGWGRGDVSLDEARALAARLRVDGGADDPVVFFGRMLRSILAIFGVAEPGGARWIPAAEPIARTAHPAAYAVFLAGCVNRGRGPLDDCAFMRHAADVIRATIPLDVVLMRVALVELPRTL